MKKLLFSFSLLNLIGLSSLYSENDSFRESSRIDAQKEADLEWHIQTNVLNGGDTVDAYPSKVEERNYTAEEDHINDVLNGGD